MMKDVALHMQQAYAPKTQNRQPSSNQLDNDRIMDANPGRELRELKS
jgi:hypothetical protein